MKLNENSNGRRTQLISSINYSGSIIRARFIGSQFERLELK